MSSEPNPAGRPQEPRKASAADLPIAAPGAPGGVSDRELERFQGTWRSVEMVIDGRRIPPGALQHRRIIVVGDKYVVVDGDETLRRGALRVDPSATPARIDAIPLDGPNAGKVDMGIYELAGDLLRICWAPPGRPRPGDFKPEPGSGRWMATDQRVTPAMADGESRVAAVSGESSGCPGVHTTRVHHRDYPELSGEGETPYEAALVLLRHLVGEAGTTAGRWQQEVQDRVIADVRAFIDRVS